MLLFIKSYIKHQQTFSVQTGDKLSLIERKKKKITKTKKQKITTKCWKHSRTLTHKLTHQRNLKKEKKCIKLKNTTIDTPLILVSGYYWYTPYFKTLFRTNPGNNILQNSRCMVTYLPSHKPSKDDMQGIAGEVKTNFKRRSLMDSYTWINQYWPTSTNFHTSGRTMDAV